MGLDEVIVGAKANGRVQTIGVRIRDLGGVKDSLG